MSIVYENDAYSSTQPTAPIPAPAIYLPSNPTINSFAPPGTIWINKITPAAFVNMGTISGQAQWGNITGGSGFFTDITVTNTATIGGALTVSGISTFLNNVGITGLLSANGGIATNGGSINTGANGTITTGLNGTITTGTSGNITTGTGGNITTGNSGNISTGAGGTISSNTTVSGTVLIARSSGIVASGQVGYTATTAAVGGATPATADKQLTINVEGVNYFIPLFATAL